VRQTHSLWTGSYDGAQCVRSEAFGLHLVIKEYTEKQIDCIIGLANVYTLAPVARIAPFWNIPVLTTIGRVPEFDDKQRYSTLTRVSGTCTHECAHIHDPTVSLHLIQFPTTCPSIKLRHTRRTNYSLSPNYQPVYKVGSIIGINFFISHIDDVKALKSSCRIFCKVVVIGFGSYKGKDVQGVKERFTGWECMYDSWVAHLSASTHALRTWSYK
jgi:hypothetical protein